MNTNSKLNQIGWKLSNSYTKLPTTLYEKQDPTSVKDPKLVIFNNELSESIGLNSKLLNSELGAYILSGNLLPADSTPIAQAYAGHQFGYFTMLGDGRAILIGEQTAGQSEIYDIQLKGAGPTPFSRRGDGRATLSSMLREYIISEAMNSLGVPTTRSLAVVTTGEDVLREYRNDGAILTRVSKGHIRVGTFQYAASKSDDLVESLAKYTIERFYPELLKTDNVYISLLEKVIDQQARLISKWQLLGFIHGVMNTDNMSIAGETIDYGPCAFMDIYNKKTVFSSIDRGGRYAYFNQPLIAQWNLARFAETLLPFLHQEQKVAIEMAEQALINFMDLYDEYWLKGMKGKLGIFSVEEEDKQLIDELLDIMETDELDYTNTFVNLMNIDYEISYVNLSNWIQKWKARLSRQSNTWSDSLKLMKDNNPVVIPRNHHVERVLKDATDGDFSSLEEFMNVLKKPFTGSKSHVKFSLPPEASSTPYKTYCGT